jgi:membrane-associated phospholipid phosphatase
VLAAAAALFLDALSVPWARGLAPGVAGFFRGMTRFGKSDWYLLPTGVLVLVLLAADWRQVPPLVRFAWAEIGALVGYFFFAVAVGGLLTDLVKWTIGRSRPVLFLSDGVLFFTPVSFGYAHASFPSGHATTVAAATVAVGLISRRWGVPMAILAGIVAISRVTVGAHYPSDVAGGLFIGSAYAYGLALWLAGRGVAFRYDDRGRLKPRLGVAGRLLARRGGSRAILAALVTAIRAAFTPLPRRPP